MNKLNPIKSDPIEHIEIVKYAGASGDFNPIHTIPSVARQLGFANVIVHGTFVMNFGVKAIFKWFPNYMLKKINVRFIQPTYVGESLICEGKAYIKEQGKRKNGKIQILNESREIKLIGEFEVEHRKGN